MIGDDMGIVKKGDNISTLNIDNKNISEIYYGNTLVYSSSRIIEVVFRDIDENGKLTLATGSLYGLFDNIKTVGEYGLRYAFNGCTGISGSVSFPALTAVDTYGLENAFSGCTGITGSISFPVLTTIGKYGLKSAFNSCAGITGSISFPSLITVGDSGLYYAFAGCTSITSISFPVLTTVGSNGLSNTFYGCKGITGSVSFPALITVDTSGLSNAFNGCTGITELHFRADAQSTIEALTEYSSKFGATNATIYFDL